MPSKSCGCLGHRGRTIPIKIAFNAGKSLLVCWRFNAWILPVIALVSFLAGSLFTTQLAHLREVKADGNRVFQLMIYHTVPGKVPALESIFRDLAKMQDKYNLKVIGYWVPNEDPAWSDTFVYLVVHPSRKAADANWRALHADPEFLPYRKAAEPLIEKVNNDFRIDEVYMRATDFSGMK